MKKIKGYEIIVESQEGEIVFEYDTLTEARRDLRQWRQDAKDLGDTLHAQLFRVLREKIPLLEPKLSRGKR